MPDREQWNDRAAAAEHAVRERFGRHAVGVAWARPRWPARTGLRGALDELAVWHYWWHAHLIDCAGDALLHRPSPARERRLRMLARTVRLRTAGRWVNRFYDDIAWMGLALQRTAPERRHRPVRRISRRLAHGIDPAVGALPWHVGSSLYNAPANGPAAILLARTGDATRAAQLEDWMLRQLTDETTGLVRDGVEGGVVRDTLYTYNQGVALGAQLALATDSDPSRADAAAALVRAIAAWCEPDGLLPTAGGGDGGLFAGILCRYLAEAAVRLADRPETADAAASARRLVLSEARALWDGRLEIDGRPLFSADPRRGAVAPSGRDGAPRAAVGGATDGGSEPDGDLSVQLGAWMTLEAAVAVTS